MHPSMAEPFKLAEFGVEILGSFTHFLRNGTTPTQMMALRCMTNMFKNQSSTIVIKNQMKGVAEVVAPKLADGNKNVRLSASTLLINFSIVCIDQNKSDVKQHILQLLTGPCQSETDCKNY